jgi:hypothetical protein
VYATGVGSTPLVFFGATPLHPTLTTLSPGVVQLTAPIPAGVAGPQPVLVSADLAHSNTVRVTIP